METDSPTMNLTIAPWRVKLFLGFMAIIALYKINSNLQSIQHDLNLLREVAQVESEEYPTPPGVEERIETWRRNLGEYHDIPLEPEVEAEGDGEE